MKKILFTVLAIASATGHLLAQSDYVSAQAKYRSRSKAEQTFNAYEGLINIRDFVVLKEGRLILELSDLNDYKDFHNMDSLLERFQKDITFYKDSLRSDPTGNMRIDYAMNTEYGFKKIRVKRYRPDGNMFLNNNGDISRLKFEQDTVRLVIQKFKPGLGNKKNPCMIPYSIQATFLLDNYYDVDKVIADHALRGIIDTLENRSRNKGTEKMIYSHPISILYNPYMTGKNIRVYKKTLMTSDNISYRHPKRKFDLDVYMGAGLVRNTLATMAEAGFRWNNRVGNRNNTQDRDFVRLSVAPYFFFGKNIKGEYTVSDNWFINACVGSVYGTNAETWLGPEASFGVGYLAVNNGGYFKGTTMKVFTNLQIRPKFTISPEVIATNNFKQFFPGFTVKVF